MNNPTSVFFTFFIYSSLSRLFLTKRYYSLITVHTDFISYFFSYFYGKIKVYAHKYPFI